MLNQKINLYQLRFREKRIILSAMQMMVASLTFFIVLAVTSVWYNGEYEQSTVKNQLALQQKQQLTEKSRRLRLKLDNLLANNEFEDEITKVSRDIAVRQRMIEFVSHNQFGSGQGFSANLGELSVFSIKDVWLNKIILSDGFMKLSGSALNAENVPEYFNSLRSRKLFQGQNFDVFQVDRPQARSWKVDFVIASSVEHNE